MAWHTIAAIVLAVSLTAACTAEDPEEVNSALDDLIVAAEPTALVFDSTESLNLAGVTTKPSKIAAGECFNEYLFRDQSDFVQQVTTIVGCDGPHDREAYFAREYPAGEDDSYPLDEQLDRWAKGVCLDEFEGFVGLEYVLSALELGAIVPTFESWTDDDDRNVICYVYPDQGGRLLASVGNSGI